MAGGEGNRAGRIYRIGHVVQNLGIGGLERIVVALMEKVDSRMFSSSVYALGQGGVLMKEMQQKGYRAVALGRTPGIDVRLPLRLSRLFRADRLDVVHCHNFGAMFYGAPAGRLARATKIIYSAHGPGFLDRPRHAVFHRLPVVDRVVTVSDFIRKSAIRDVGLNENKVVTIRNGIDVDRFAEVDAEAVSKKRKELAIEEGDLVIGVVARLSPEKDHGTLLDACARIAPSNERVRLVVVGDGPALEDLKQRAGRLNLTKRAHFLGDRRDIPELLRLFSVFVLPSREEGLGITLIEAMAAGVPVVATNVGGIPEVITHGETGILVEPGNAAGLGDGISRIFDQPEQARVMVDRARQHVRESFSLTGMIGKYEKLYHSVLMN